MFSASAIAQTHQDERDLENRTAPVKTETTTKTKTKTVSKGDADYKDQAGVRSDVKGNKYCCGKEKNDGFMGKWKIRDNDADLNKDASMKTKSETKTKSESEVSSGLRSEELEGGVSTEVELNDDGRMDAGGRSNIELNANDDALINDDASLDSEIEVGTRSNLDLDVSTEEELNKDSKKSGCPTHDKSHEMEDTNTPK
jgi:hypothetical protein